MVTCWFKTSSCCCMTDVCECRVRTTFVLVVLVTGQVSWRHVFCPKMCIFVNVNICFAPKCVLFTFTKIHILGQNCVFCFCTYDTCFKLTYPATYYSYFVFCAASLCRFPICTHKQGHWFLYSEKTDALPGSALDDQRSPFCYVNQKVPGSTGQDCGERSEHLWLWRQEWAPKMGVQEWNADRPQRPAALHRSQSRWNDCALQKCWSQ